MSIVGKCTWTLVALLALHIVPARAHASPIQCGDQLGLVRTLDTSGLAIGGVAWHQSQLWTVNQSGIQRRLDPISGQILETIPTGHSTHNGLGSDGSTLYMSYDPGGATLFHYVLNSVEFNWPTPTSGARDMTYQGGGLWYADFDNGQIMKMNPLGGAPLIAPPFAAPGGFGASGLEWDGQHLLFTRHDGNILYFIRPTDGGVDCQIDMSGFNPTIAGGLAWDGQYLYGADFDRIYVIGVVPEPGTFLLLMAGGLGAMSLRRRRGSPS